MNSYQKISKFFFLCITLTTLTLHAEDKKISSQTTEKTTETKIPKKYNRITNQRYHKNFKPKEIPTPQIVKVVKDPKKDTLLKKGIRDLTLDELITAKEYAAALGDKELAIKYSERIVTISNDQEELRATRLELADLYFDKGDVKHSGKLYRTYVEFYPGSKHRDYAEYKSVLCRFYARLKPPLDQSLTRKTISLANRYLDRTDKKSFADDVINIRQTCYKDLYEYEIDIFKQYINLEKFTAAQTRLESIKQDFLTVMPEIEPALIENEGILAQKQGKQSIVTQKIDELSRRFPAYNPTTLIAHAKPKKRFIDLF